MNRKNYKQIITFLKSHGLSNSEAKLALEEYDEPPKKEALLERLKIRGGPVKVIKDQGSTVFLDGKKELGQLAAEKATKFAAEKAKRYGIGLVGLKNILSFSHPGTYAKKLANNNLIDLVMIDGGRAMVTHPNSPEPVIGTNPLAFAIPTSKGPLVVDMATSKHAWAVVRKALAEGTKLPPETYKDKAGKFTRDPKKAYSVLPFGDYKGFALGMLVEILCGGLLGLPMGKTKKPSNYLLANKGAIFIAIDPAKFGSTKSFEKTTTKFLNEIKTLKRNPGIKKLHIPGESGFKK